MRFSKTMVETLFLEPINEHIIAARFALFVDKRGNARVAKVSEPRSRCNGIIT
jgi:hypothetical protein